MYDGKLIRLREVRKSDVELIWHRINNPEVRKGITLGIPYPFTELDEEKWFQSHSAMNDIYGFAIEAL
ncbi:MAG: GNAT family N-acetyltransferase, partial [Spirochaetaceae bacterium 4572_7]